MCVLSTLKYVCTYYTQVHVYLLHSGTCVLNNLVPWIFTHLRLLACQFLSLDRL